MEQRPRVQPGIVRWKMFKCRVDGLAVFHIADAWEFKQLFCTCQATLAQAMRESELGLPVMVRATPQAKLWWQEGRFGANKQPGAIRTRPISRCLRNAKSGASLPLGLFLLVQNDYWLLE